MARRGRDPAHAGPLIGAHMSIAGGIHKAFERGVGVGCRTIQLFVKSPTRWKPQAFTKAHKGLCLREARRTGLAPVIAHASYLINLCSTDEALWERSIASLTEELLRAEAIGATDLVVHPGSFRGADVDFGIRRAAEAVARIVRNTPRVRARLTIETTAGAGSTLCGRFEEIAALLETAGAPRRFAVCVDTCHIHAAGYNITSGRKLARTLAEFDAVVGIARLAVLHLNDCRAERGSHLDRHQHIGRGTIGLAAFRAILRDERFGEVPKIIETPKFDREGKAMDAVNLSLLEELAR